jgi:hypothetical protein
MQMEGVKGSECGGSEFRQNCASTGPVEPFVRHVIAESHHFSKYSFMNSTVE